MDAMTIIGAASIISAGLCIAIGSFAVAIGEGNTAATALSAMAQQPDEANRIRSTLFVALAMVETSALYCLLITFLILYSNPFWDHVIAK